MIRFAFLLILCGVALPLMAHAADPMRAPMVATWTGPPEVRAGQTIVVKLEIGRTIINKLPLDVTMTVPEGVEIIGKSLPKTIVDGKSKLIRHTLKLQLKRVPTTDLVATVAVQGQAYGVTANAVYRFGRPPPKLPDPAQGQRDIKVNGRSFGPAIPLN
ncbi:MAG: hypothetical protein EXR77_07095 [Myxococcales bacterium]|nr:hypothetical protein [Myxococcales bacterium]